MKNLTAGLPGRKLSWPLLSLETGGEEESKKVSQTTAETKTRKMTRKEAGTTEGTEDKESSRK